MDRPEEKTEDERSFGDLVLAWGGLVGGVLGTAIAAVSYRESRKTGALATRTRAHQLLAEAWDLMGGKPGTVEIFGPARDRESLELGRRKVNEALELDPRSGWAHRILGVYYALLKDYPNALSYLQKSADLARSGAAKSKAYTSLGNVLHAMGEPEKAREAFERAVELDPSDYFPHYNLGVFYSFSGDLQRGLELFKRSREINPMFVDCWVNEAHVLLRLGDPIAAMERCQNALDIAPDDCRAHHVEALILHRLGKVDKAIAVLRRCGKLDPRYRPAKEMLRKLLAEHSAGEVTRERNQ
ncbi:MAG TPA: tetratricopeptide repeat protein [Longimicrobiaceae bacterium]|nr:tetratricopeptide repeat protein [Longimicrobiaceae bacterium]